MNPSGVTAALVTPLTGPLAGYGSAGATALRLWAEHVGASITVHDAHPNPLAALGEAERRRPDLFFGPYGSGPAVTVAAATSRLMWNHGGARVAPSGLVVNVLAPAGTYWEGALHALVSADPGGVRVAVLQGATGFGREVAGGAIACAAALGLRATLRSLPAPDPPDDPGLAGADVLLVAGGFEEERRAAATLLPGRWRAAGFVGAGVAEVLADLGARREGLLGPAQWLAAAAPDPDEGPPAADFVAAYRRATAGADPAYPAAAAFAAGVIAARCLREAGSTAPDDLRSAAAALDRTTLFGRFRLDPATGHQVGHRMLTVQWQDGSRRVVWPPDRSGGARLCLAPPVTSRR